MKAFILAFSVLWGSSCFGEKLGAVLLGQILERPVFLVFKQRIANISPDVDDQSLFKNIVFGESGEVVGNLLKYSSDKIAFGQLVGGVDLSKIIRNGKNHPNSKTSFIQDSMFIYNGKLYPTDNSFLSSMIVGPNVVDYSLNIINECTSFSMPSTNTQITLPKKFQNLLSHRRFIKGSETEGRHSLFLLLGLHLLPDFVDRSDFGVYFKNRNPLDYRKENLYWLPNKTIGQLNKISKPDFVSSENNIKLQGNQVRVSVLSKRFTLGNFASLEDAKIVRNLFLKAFFGRLVENFLPTYESLESVLQKLQEYNGRGLKRGIAEFDSFVISNFGKDQLTAINSYWDSVTGEYSEIVTMEKKPEKLKIEKKVAELLKDFYIETYGSKSKRFHFVSPHRAHFGVAFKRFSANLFEGLNSGDLQVSLIDGNLTNFMPGNIRLVSEKEKDYFQGKPKGEELSSKYKGVSFSKTREKEKSKKTWESALTYKGYKSRNFFQYEDDAAENYDILAICFFRGYARLNLLKENDYNLDEIRAKSCEGLWGDFEREKGIHPLDIKFTNQLYLDAVFNSLGLQKSSAT